MNQQGTGQSLMVAESPHALPDIYRSPQDLEMRLVNMKAERDIVQNFIKEVMIKDEDFGVIPGTKLPSLYKAGAEKLCELYGYAPTIVDKAESSDEATGHCRYVITVALVQKGTGVRVAECIGECSTRESKYLYRWEYDNNLPPGFNTTGLKFKSGESARGPWKQYRIENDDLHSLWNTILKMAFKRAFVGAVHQATRSSGLFSMSANKLDEWATEGEYRYIDDDDDDPLPGDVPAGAPAKSSTRQGSTARQPQGTQQDAMSVFWKSVDALKIDRDTASAKSQEWFANKEPAQLTAQERSQLLTRLKNEPSGTAAPAATTYEPHDAVMVFTPSNDPICDICGQPCDEESGQHAEAQPSMLPT